MELDWLAALSALQSFRLEAFGAHFPMSWICSLHTVFNKRMLGWIQSWVCHYHRTQLNVAELHSREATQAF